MIINKPLDFVKYSKNSACILIEEYVPGTELKNIFISRKYGARHRTFALNMQLR
jgi:hypothetical protein